LGSEFLVDSIITEAQRTLVMSEVKIRFRPEFLNRLDDIILFHPLSAEQLAQILDLLLKKEVRLAAGSGLALQIGPDSKAWLLAQNDHPEWGARPLRRILRRHLREPLADFLLRTPPQPGTVVQVDLEGEGLRFTAAASSTAG
jgi:ATP-dependent Clp protease ATP-binding subunit ClpB